MVLRVEVGTQNRSKINPKIYSKIKCVLASIFLDFGRFWEASWGRNGSKNRCKNASKKRCKFRCVLDASWVGVPTDVPWSRGPGPPLLHYFKKKHLQTQTHMTQMNHTLHARQARWRILFFHFYFYLLLLFFFSFFTFIITLLLL